MMKEEPGLNHDRNEALAGELIGQAVIALLNSGEDISFTNLLHELAAMKSQASSEAVRKALDTASSDVRARMNEGKQESDAGEHYFQTRDSSEDDALH